MNLIDKLLSVDKEELTKECTKTYHSKNMERLTGDGEITLQKSQRKKAERTCIKYIGTRKETYSW